MYLEIHERHSNAASGEKDPADGGADFSDSFQIIWFYLNWHLLKARGGLRVTPLVRTLLAPFFIWSFYGTLEQQMGTRYPWSLPPLIAASLYFLLHLASVVLDRVAEGLESAPLALASLVFGMGPVLLLLPAVRALNALRERDEPGLPMRATLSPGAIVTVILGGIILLLYIAGLASMPW